MATDAESLAERGTWRLLGVRLSAELASVGASSLGALAPAASLCTCSATAYATDGHCYPCYLCYPCYSWGLVGSVGISTSFKIGGEASVFPHGLNQQS